MHIRHPTLAFAGLPVKVIPFPLAEAQAALLARVWANEVALPPAAAMAAWSGEAVANVTNWWARCTASRKVGGAMHQPIFHPVRLNVLPALLTVTVRSASTGSVAARMWRAGAKTMCS